MKRDHLSTDAFYHVFTKSIAGYCIFRDDQDYARMINLIKYYRLEKPPTRFSSYISLQDKELFFSKYCLTRDLLVDVISYCIMPTHLHIALQQRKGNGISAFMGNVLNSYTRYFNTRSGRKGPLWQSRFKHVPVESNEQLSHLTRYIHLNPVTEHLCEDPDQWKYSSYREYVDETKDALCVRDEGLFRSRSAYRDFVLDQKEYQRSLAHMKSLHLE
ncbi:MAG: transposase [Nitrospirae bacterium]|nr:transposase [Nitrospirota bacterium]